MKNVTNRVLLAALLAGSTLIASGVTVPAAAQIGGVLEPINASPVIIEDDVIVGGNASASVSNSLKAGL